MTVWEVLISGVDFLQVVRHEINWQPAIENENEIAIRDRALPWLQRVASRRLGGQIKLEIIG